MNKWAKTALFIAAPLVLGTTVYAMANDSAETSETAANNTLIQIQEVAPTPAAPSDTAAMISEIPNPFIVNKEEIKRELAAKKEQEAKSSQASTMVPSNLTIDQLKKLHKEKDVPKGHKKKKSHGDDDDKDEKEDD